MDKAENARQPRPNEIIEYEKNCKPLRVNCKSLDDVHVGDHVSWIGALGTKAWNCQHGIVQNIDNNTGEISMYHYGKQNGPKLIIMEKWKLNFEKNYVRKFDYGENCHPPLVVMERAEACIWSKYYKTLWSDNEHFCQWVKSGKHAYTVINESILYTFLNVNDEDGTHYLYVSVVGELAPGDHISWSRICTQQQEAGVSVWSHGIVTYNDGNVATIIGYDKKNQIMMEKELTAIHLNEYSIRKIIYDKAHVTEVVTDRARYFKHRQYTQETSKYYAHWCKTGIIQKAVEAGQCSMDEFTKDCWDNPNKNEAANAMQHRIKEIFDYENNCTPLRVNCKSIDDLRVGDHASWNGALGTKTYNCQHGIVQNIDNNTGEISMTMYHYGKQKGSKMVIKMEKWKLNFEKNDVHKFDYDECCHPLAVVMERAQACIGMYGFNKFCNNNEDFCRWVKSGKHTYLLVNETILYPMLNINQDGTHHLVLSVADELTPGDHISWSRISSPSQEASDDDTWNHGIVTDNEGNVAIVIGYDKRNQIMIEKEFNENHFTEYNIRKIIYDKAHTTDVVIDRARYLKHKKYTAENNKYFAHWCKTGIPQYPKLGENRDEVLRQNIRKTYSTAGAAGLGIATGAIALVVGTLIAPGIGTIAGGAIGGLIGGLGGKIGGDIAGRNLADAARRPYELLFVDTQSDDGTN